MILYRVTDLDVNEACTGAYDLVLFASSTEERCTYIPEKLEQTHPVHPVILGSPIPVNDPRRQASDEYFLRRWDTPTLIDGDDDTFVYHLLREKFTGKPGDVRILIDYSSMSPLWYTAVLNWASFYEGQGSVFVDFLYSVGDHKGPTTPVVISGILSLPGCEGLPVPLSKSVAVFGLGFEGSAALCVLDQLEPDELYCYLAKPAAFPDYPGRVRKANRQTIRLANACIELPLSSVEYCFASLAELVSRYKLEASVTLVPMGPKPHVLAAVLIAMRFEEVGCLRVAHQRRKPERVATTGHIVATRVQFRTSLSSVVGPTAS